MISSATDNNKTATPQLVVRNLTVQFNNRHLFSSDELTLNKGEHIYLQGENGCGKSTLMKILAGLQKPTTGQFHWHTDTPRPWWHFGRGQAWGQIIYLHQYPYVYDGTVLDNLNLPLPQRKQADYQQRVTQALTLAHLDHLAHSRAHELSGGEKQRLAIARVWLLNPNILLLDEATANMDSKSQRCILDMVQNLVEQGTGLVISSHHTNQLTDLCQQSWHIAEQKITMKPWQPQPSPPPAIISLEDIRHV